MTTLQLIAQHGTQMQLAAHAIHAAQVAAAPYLPAGTPGDLDSAVNNLKAGINHLLGYILPIGLVLCALYYGWGGLHWMAAGSNPRLGEKARTIWWHATVGLLGVILATAAVNTIKGFFGL